MVFTCVMLVPFVISDCICRFPGRRSNLVVAIFVMLPMWHVDGRGHSLFGPPLLVGRLMGLDVADVMLHACKSRVHVRITDWAIGDLVMHQILVMAGWCLLSRAS